MLSTDSELGITRNILFVLTNLILPTVLFPFTDEETEAGVSVTFHNPCK